MLEIKHTAQGEEEEVRKIRRRVESSESRLHRLLSDAVCAVNDPVVGSNCKEKRCEINKM